MNEKKVKTKKVVKRRLKLKGVFILTLFFAIIFLSVKFILKLQIGVVTVTGNNFLKDSQIIKEAGLNESVQYFKFNTRSSCEQLTKNPYIKSCKYKRSLNLNLEIVIEENAPLFYYLPESKIVLSDASRIDGEAKGLPTLINYTTEDVLTDFINRLSKVKSDIILSISEIEYVPSTSEDGTPIDSNRFMMIMNDGNTVYINNKRMNNLNHYDTIFATIGEKKGVINFDWDYGNYGFTEYKEQS